WAASVTRPRVRYVVEHRRDCLGQGPAQPPRAPTPDHSSPERRCHMPTFSSLGVPEVLVRSLAAREISAPFPIQTATLPDALAGRDVLGRGRTGSGKTLAFSLPMVARLARLAGSEASAGRP